jgi:hypothetical protein
MNMSTPNTLYRTSQDFSDALTNAIKKIPSNGGQSEFHVGNGKFIVPNFSKASLC